MRLSSTHSSTSKRGPECRASYYLWRGPMGKMPSNSNMIRFETEIIATRVKLVKNVSLALNDSFRTRPSLFRLRDETHEGCIRNAKDSDCRAVRCAEYLLRLKTWLPKVFGLNLIWLLCHIQGNIRRAIYSRVVMPRRSVLVRRLRSTCASNRYII